MDIIQLEEQHWDFRHHSQWQHTWRATFRQDRASLYHQLFFYVKTNNSELLDKFLWEITNVLFTAIHAFYFTNTVVWSIQSCFFKKNLCCCYLDNFVCSLLIFYFFDRHFAHVLPVACHSLFFSPFTDSFLISYSPLGLTHSYKQLPKPLMIAAKMLQQCKTLNQQPIVLAPKGKSPSKVLWGVKIHIQAFYTPSILCVRTANILQHTIAAQMFIC